MFNKKFFFYLIILFLANNAYASSVIFSDNFDSGSLTGYDVNSGTWSAATNKLVGASLDTGSISREVIMLEGADYNISFKNDPNVNTQLAHLYFFTDQNGLSNINGYDIHLQGNNLARLRRMTNGVPTNIGTGGVMNIGIMHDVNLNIDGNGLMILIIDGNIIVNATDTTYKSGRKIIFATENAAGDAFWDNIIITTDANYSPTLDINYSNFGTDSTTGRKYVNTLNYSITYFCSGGGNGILKRYINSVNDLNNTVPCNSVTGNINGTYQNPINGNNFIIDFNLIDTSLRQTTFTDTNFFSDLNVPIIDINFSSSVSGFSTSAGSVNAYMTCFDNVSPKIKYDLNNTTTSTNIFNSQYDANSTQSSSVSVANGENFFTGSCTDLAGNSEFDTNSFTPLATCFVLVDELNGVALSNTDINAFTSLTATSYNTGAVNNFKSPLSNNICFTSVTDDTIRFDLNYASGTGLYKEFNLGIAQDINTTLNICVADDQDFFEQLFTASQQRKVILKNQLSECYSLADYTKYALQDTLSHRAFTIQMPYNLQTDVDGNTVILALINGAVESTINLDVLVFKNETITTGLQPDELSIALYLIPPLLDSNTVVIYYNNLAANNTIANIKIFDGNSQIYNQTITTTPNAFTIYFDTTTLDINSDVLKVQITKTLTDGTTEILTRYFTMSGNQAIFPSGLGILFSFILVLFGFTLIRWSYVLGWFGLIVTIAGITILGFTAQTGQVIFLQAVLLIAGVYIFIIFKDETVRQT